jgi:hypothetical protein
MTDYEALLSKQFGRVGIEDAIAEIQRRVYEAIGKAYPDLKSECEQQWAAREQAALEMELAKR